MVRFWYGRLLGMAFLARDQALCGALWAWEGKEFSLAPARSLTELPCRLNFFKMTGQMGGSNWVTVVTRDVVPQLYFKNEQGTGAVFSLSPVTCPEVFAKVNSAQFPSRF